MPGVTQRTVATDDSGMRLDRWFKREFPGLSHIRLEKLLKRGEIRLDGKRVKAGDRLETGQTLRIPPLDRERLPVEKGDRPARPAPVLTPEEVDALQAMVLYRDEQVLVLNKPPGLAVQGGEKIDRHIDGMLDALMFDAKERPKLVHRLDRDTSGLLLLARTAPAARALTASFRSRESEKLYWALVAGTPTPVAGVIDQALAKGVVGKTRAVEKDDPDAKYAVTGYATVDSAGKQAAWVALQPLTGRTHQLRAHMAVIGTPIVGDGKYGGRDAFLKEAGVPEQLHLHARRLRLPHPVKGKLDLVAPLPQVMIEGWRALGFEPTDAPYSDSFPADLRQEDERGARLRR